jgi:VIT1/CCC1 family predicted Fe2+/Mn2+ transporter
MAQTTRRSLTVAHVLCAVLLIATGLIAAWYSNESIWYGIILVIIVFAVVGFGGQRLERWLRRVWGARTEKSGDGRRPGA